jgi:hypothetical protein
MSQLMSQLTSSSPSSRRVRMRRLDVMPVACEENAEPALLRGRMRPSRLLCAAGWGRAGSSARPDEAEPALVRRGGTPSGAAAGRRVGSDARRRLGQCPRCPRCSAAVHGASAVGGGEASASHGNPSRPTRLSRDRGSCAGCVTWSSGAVGSARLWPMATQNAGSGQLGEHCGPRRQVASACRRRHRPQRLPPDPQQTTRRPRRAQKRRLGALAARTRAGSASFRRAVTTTSTCPLAGAPRGDENRLWSPTDVDPVWC